MAYDELPEDERAIVDLVALLRATGDTDPLVALLRGADGGPERARDALQLLGELDPGLLVQVALNSLSGDPDAAGQTRGTLRGLH